MKVSVDPDKCQGHARCWDLCPEVFTIDDDGYASTLVDEVPPELEEKVGAAQRNCPERAIDVV
jgi:ferredoxin